MSRNIESIYPMSSLQEGMLYHGLLASGQGLYVQQFVCELNGELEEAGLRSAWEEVVRRHAVLRTLFAWDRKGPPLQIVRERVEVPWAFSDWTVDGDPSSQERLDKFLKADSVREFDLGRAPLMRLQLLRIGENLHTLVWTFSHLILDGWSTALLLREVLTMYAARRQKREPVLFPAFPYREFIACLQERDDSEEESFWREYLGREAGLSLLCKAGFPDARALTQERHCESLLEFSVSESEWIETGARALKVTLNTLFQGAWALLLQRYTGEATVTYGITVSGRGGALADVEQRVGLFINTLALRARVEAEKPLRDWLPELQARQRGAMHFEHVSLARVKAWCDVPPGEPLFDTILVFENYPLLEGGEEGGALEIRAPRYFERSEFPLSLIVVPGTSLRVKAVYDTERFCRPMVEAILDNLRAALSAMVEEPAARLGELSLLAPGEVARLQEFGRGPRLELPEGRRVQQLIEEVASRDPAAPALDDGRRRLSYAELETNANRFAARLRDSGAQAGALVPILLPRGVDYVIAILAVLKTGAAYVPLDPGSPAERIDRILVELGGAQSTAARMVVALPDAEQRFAFSGMQRISPDQAPSSTSPNGTAASPVAQCGADLAYVIYTSGTSGRPKGVMVSHDNLLASTCARFHAYPRPPKRFLLLSPFAFDSSVAGIFWTLCQGGTLYVSTPGAEQDIAALSEFIGAKAITHTLCLPSLYRYLIEYGAREALRTLEVAIVAGEVCPGALAALHRTRLPGVDLHNEYGPTEMTVWCTVHAATDADSAAALSIGRVVANTQALLLDDRGKPVPWGAPGELVFAGAGLAQGYLDQPALTASSFVDVCPWGEADVTVYRSGDYGRFRPDGCIEFTGRKDHQLKIRGHRLEPGEISAVIEEHPAIAEAVVIPREREGTESESNQVARDDRQAGALELVAFVVPVEQDAANLVGLGSFIEERLPDYMRPAAIVELAKLPRTETGKIARESLPKVFAQAVEVQTETYQTPVTKTEQKLAGIWREVLKVERVGLNDSFFRLGGDSLSSIQATALAARQDLDLSANEIFLRPVLRDLAATIDSGQRELLDVGEGEGRGANMESIGPAKAKPTFFAIYGEGWAEFIPPEQPYVWLPHPNEDYAPVEELAATYLNDIRSVQADGPYHLGGFSFGGLIALETARQLMEAGEEIAYLALFEPTPPRQFGDSLSRSTGAAALNIAGTPRIDALLKRVPYGPLRRRLRWGLLRATGVLRQLQWQWARSRGKAMSATLDLFHLATLWVQAWREYHCRSYPGRVVVFAAEGSWQNLPVQTRLRCWEEVAEGGAEIVCVSGIPRHIDLIKKPYSQKLVHALMKQLDSCFAREVHSAPAQTAQSPSSRATIVR